MTPNNPDVTQHFHSYGELLRRIDDLVEQAERYQKARLTPFLRPNEIEAVKRYLGKKHDYRFDGGYPQAEMKRLIIGKGDSEILCLCADISNREIKLEHRDVYGALMNLGMRREQFGDLFLKDGKAYIYVCADSAQYVIENLTKIHRLSVDFHVCEPVENDVRIKEYVKTVSSYRLDAIVQTMANISRARAQEMIRAKLVSLNFEVLEDVDALCHNEDTISIRSYGKFRLYETLSETRKKRLLIRFGKYE